MTRVSKKSPQKINRQAKYIALLVIIFLLVSLAISLTLIKQNQEMRKFAKDTPQSAFGKSHRPVCPGGSVKEAARCHARIIVEADGSPQASQLPVGFGPVQLRNAYALSGVAKTNQTIAIVDAYDEPNILNDLNKYSSTYGLPKMNACPVSLGMLTSPCFQKVDQNGGTNYPKVDANWAMEIALDVEVAHAICQNCNILLVEASSNYFSDLVAAVDRANLMGATVISNSYGGPEFLGQSSYSSHYNLPGKAVVASTGDTGYGVDYPAAYPYVTAVGGTTLTLSGNSYQSETAWSGAGSGCSAYESKPAFQTDSGCLKRTVADISAVADPNTGAAVYNSVSYKGKKGWFTIGGTSLAAPIIAGVYALAGGVPAGIYGNALPYTQGNSTNLHDVTIGSNGSCAVSYLCTSTAGFDGPTGLGTPNGIGAF